MHAFSIEKSLTSGFRLLRTQWKTALAWGAIYIAVILAIELLMFGPALVQTLASGGKDPESAAKLMERSFTDGGWPLMVLGYLLMLVAIIVIYGAVARSQLRPEEDGRLFIRFSRRELWMGLSLFVMCLILIPAMCVAALAVVALIGVLSGGDGGNSVLLALALGIPATIGGLYVMLRLSFGWLMAWDESRFVLFDSWRLTKGQGWRLVLFYLALIFMILIAMMGVVLVVLVISGVAGLAAKALGPAGVIVGVVGIVAAIVCYVAMIGGFLVIGISPWIEAYRELRDAKATEPAPAAG